MQRIMQPLLWASWGLLALVVAIVGLEGRERDAWNRKKIKELDIEYAYHSEFMGMLQDKIDRATFDAADRLHIVQLRMQVIDLQERVKKLEPSKSK